MSDLTERERILVLEKNHEQFMKEFITYSEENSKQHTEIKELIEQMGQKLDTALEKKAGIWVEKVLIWFGSIVGIGVIGYLGSLIIKVIEKVK